ncbi:hypothetical protein GGR21_002015 [Dysgonomonas hofstadii]|uniref:Hint domain-containing protein n=1 Tax=Dysgonomonas hofstadii TaxID=637886 RepID=A0A840CR86_9BACT|nr:Hint domain-containing protein [Dysgonomonas hofstadii]MBB4036114.1 hypothetical protein [Dysgonomonas hofstadii]
MRIRLFLSTLVCLFVFGLNMKAQTSIASGTQITMSDDAKKNIENIKAGDKVLAFNTKDKVYEEKTVKSVSKVMMNRLVRITLESGVQIVLTVDYPVLGEKGWVSVDPNRTMMNKKYTEVQRCNIGEYVLFYNVTSTDFVELTVIQGVLDPVQTYTLELEDAAESALVANGFLVGIN